MSTVICPLEDPDHEAWGELFALTLMALRASRSG